MGNLKHKLQKTIENHLTQRIPEGQCHNFWVICMWWNLRYAGKETGLKGCRGFRCPNMIRKTVPQNGGALFVTDTTKFYEKRGSTWYIVREMRSMRERERETERDREREGWGVEWDISDVIRVALKLAISSHFPLPKIRTLPFDSKWSPLWYHEFTLALHKITLFALSLGYEKEMARQVIEEPKILPWPKKNPLWWCIMYMCASMHHSEIRL